MPINLLYTKVSEYVAKGKNSIFYFPVTYLKEYDKNLPNYIIDFTDLNNHSIIVTVKKHLINVNNLPIIAKAVVTKFDNEKNRWYFDVSRSDCLFYELSEELILKFLQFYNYTIYDVKYLLVRASKHKNVRKSDGSIISMYIPCTIFANVNASPYSYTFVFSNIDNFRKVAVFGELILGFKRSRRFGLVRRVVKLAVPLIGNLQEVASIFGD